MVESLIVGLERSMKPSATCRLVRQSTGNAERSTSGRRWRKLSREMHERCRDMRTTSLLFWNVKGLRRTHVTLEIGRVRSPARAVANRLRSLGRSLSQKQQQHHVASTRTPISECEAA